MKSIIMLASMCHLLRFVSSVCQAVVGLTHSATNRRKTRTVAAANVKVGGREREREERRGYDATSGRESDGGGSGIRDESGYAATHES